jgi:glycosyltransferase involved in cell wall biosynthesis
MSESQPAVTVGLPVYNGERHLGAAIDSLLAQTYADFRLILSDNASTDGTEGICREYAVRDPRIGYYRHEVNRGGAWNFNYVAKLARSPYFKWAAHDDECEPTHLGRCVDALQRAPRAVLAYPRTALIDATGAVIGLYDDRLDLRNPRPVERLRMFVHNVRRSNAVFGLIRRDALSRTRLFGRFWSADYALLIELLLQGEFVEVPESLFRRRLLPEAASEASVPVARMRWFIPTFDRRWAVPRTRRAAEMLRAVGRARLPIAMRFHAGGVFLLAWWRRDWKQMAWEYVVAGRSLVAARPD